MGGQYIRPGCRSAQVLGYTCHPMNSLRRAPVLALCLAASVVLSGCVRYEDGRAAFDQQNYPRALSRWQLLAKFGDARAQNELGYLYERGLGVAPNAVEAVTWYRLAAEQGLAAAQNNLGLMFMNGNGVTQSHAEAARWFKLASAQNHAAAQNNLGVLYDKGLGVPEDNAEAAKLFQAAATNGDARAKKNLGVMYRKGEGVPQDLAKAIEWFKAAAEAGDAEAMNDYAVLLDNGRGTAMDKPKARELFEASARKGYSLGAVNLALSYLFDRGRGKPEDVLSAYAWLNIASAQGNERAKSLREELLTQLSPEQLRSAETLSSQLAEELAR